jgi:two-component sensor histidine kinase
MVAEARPGTEELTGDHESTPPAPGAERAPLSRHARIALTAGVYWFASKAALGLAIEPGYATPVWPAAGFALCAVLLWGKRVALGVLVGSALANFTTNLDLHSSLNVLRSLGVSGCLGLGAALQALLGARLVERFVGLPLPLEDRHAIGRFTILGGPLACVASASVGVGTLLASGLLDAARAPFSWATWWVGDSIGVVIFAPLSWLLISNPGLFWQRNRNSLALPLLGSFLVVALLFWQTRLAAADGTPGWGSWLVLGVGLWFMRVMSVYTLDSLSKVSQAQRSVVEGERRSLELEERVRARTAELSATLREREVLLQEIHHRVKNNLQVISSLINLQVRRLEDPVSRDALVECQSRVYTIALIHETLYESHDYCEMPFSDYVRGLVTSIFHLAGSPPAISLQLDLAPVMLSVDRAIPCGLILNELILNALKHAFPDGRSGKIWVELQDRGAGQVGLRVRDDGIGARDAEPEGGGELGLQLVHTLAQQIHAELSVKHATGTTVELEFLGRG